MRSGYGRCAIKADRIRPCKVCGAPVTDRKRTVRYCSPKCWYSTQRYATQIPLKFGHRKGGPKNCKTCGKEYWPSPSQRRKYCSFKCSIELSRRQIALECTNCGKDFSRGRALVTRVKEAYCSQECAWTYKRGENAPSWRGGQPKRYRGPDWRAVSEAARSRDGYKCQVCGKPQQKGQKLSVDHIIPYRIVKENVLINLISICRAPCHCVKTQVAERAFLRGDMLGFLQGLRQASWPMERVQAAISYWAAL
jgi:5-methylcytosine-specific restriction endonuclease McrA